jgi:hypothetical protein
MKVIEERNATTATPNIPRAQGRRKRMALVSKESIYNQLRIRQSKVPARTSLLDWERLSSWGDEAIKEMAII